MLAIFPAGDRDFYSIKSTGAGNIEVSAKSPEGISLQVALVDPEGKQISDWAYLPATLGIPEKGEYCLVVIDDFDDGSSDEPVDLRIRSGVIESPVPEPDAEAEDEQAADAAPTQAEDEQAADAAPTQAREEQAVELVQCPRCKGTGKMRRPVRCEECGGRGTIAVDCPMCGGTGKRKVGHREMPCPRCQGSGKIKRPCPACHGKRFIMVDMPCPACKGTGQIRQ
jgi:hypothetical protein